MLGDGSSVEGYIVEEKKNEYVVRPDLRMKNEVTVAKSKVDSIEDREITSVNSSVQAVFLKDGSIIGGVISDENDRHVVIKPEGRAAVNLPRSSILRVLYNDGYKSPQYIKKTDGTEVEAYVVDENKDSYTLRQELNVLQETVVPKLEVEEISRVIPKKKQYGPFFRFGMSDYSYPFGKMRFWTGDLFVARFFFGKYFSADMFLRAQYGAMHPAKTSSAGYDTPSNYAYDRNGSDLYVFGGGIGMRLVFGWDWLKAYVFGCAQYAQGEIRLGYIRNDGTGAKGSYKYEYKSEGGVGGAGLEVNPFSAIGVFAECSYGRMPMFKNKSNIEPFAARFGVSLRTSLY